MIRPLVAAALACAALSALAQDSPAARSLAATCAACHGTDGRSVTKEVASLAGLPRERIVSQMRAFRDGTPATIMQQIVRGYSEEQIEVIADYFSRRPR
jgi:cytochrome c553